MHFNDILSLAARAWHEIKDPKDPEFNQCQITHRENLGAAAQAVVNSGLAFSEFDKAVLRIYRADAEAQSEAERILAENPTLHGDEVMHIASGAPHPLDKNAMPGHAENAQMAAVREEFKGADVSGFTATETLEEVETARLERARRREEAQPKELKGPLPKNFPLHDLLRDAGINTYTQLSKVEDYTSIDGIGPANAEKIANRLIKDSQKEN
jgi:predicted flap endonuclease-1-like 5' DNA nuclease